MNILNVQSSGRHAHSTTRTLSAELISALRDGGASVRLTERDLTHGISFVDEAWIGANFTAPEERSAQQSAALTFSDMLVEELEAADLVVIGAPIYNFGPPAVLKAWIDQIARARRTFRYTADGPVGLLTGKRAVLVVSSGGTEVGSPADHATPYLRHALSFVGIEGVTVIAADRQSMGPDDAIARARQRIESFALAAPTGLAA